MDSGATGSLNYADIESKLMDSIPSQYHIAVAKGDTLMKGSKDGKLRIHALNTAAHKGIDFSTALEFNTTTAKGLRTELFSLDEPYRKGGWNILLRQPDFESGINEIYKAAKDGMPEARIPLRYDYTGPGGWWIDYIIHSDTT